MPKAIPITAPCLIVAIVLPAFYACAPSDPARMNQRPPQASPAADHAVYSERLEEMMGDLGVRYLRVWPQEVQAERERAARQDRSRRFTDVASVAAELNETARRLPSLVEDVGFNREQRRSFGVLSDQLAGQAAELKKAAQAEDSGAVNAVLGRINRTCSECHSRFRDQAGPLP